MERVKQKWKRRDSETNRIENAPQPYLRNAETRVRVHIARVIAERALLLVTFTARDGVDRSVKHDNLLVERHLREQLLRANGRRVGLVHPRSRLRVGGDRDGERDEQKRADVGLEHGGLTRRRTPRAAGTAESGIFTKKGSSSDHACQ